MTYLHVNINGKELKALAGQTILQVAKEAEIHIPNLCYDQTVETYGACGLCVVEVAGSSKLARACATEIADHMIIFTDSPAVRSSRKLALELLLSNHKGDCRPPCRQACPGETDCQGYVGLIANGYLEEAVALIKETYPLPASIGRVCPHPCEDACRRQKVDEPIAIAWLKQLAADVDLASENPFMPEIAPKTGKTLAVVGGGPAGLTMAFFMAKAGHQVTIYEMMPQAGGMLRYGIPEYRLPKQVLTAEIDLIEAMGVKIVTDVKIGKDIEFSYLRANYDAIYLSIGAWKSSAMRCEGEDLDGVLGGIEFLTDVALNKHVYLGKRVAVVGGGNTAMDACRTAVRLGAEEVYLLYRRTKKEMPAAAIEIEEAEEEGVLFKYLVAPTKVLGAEGKVVGLELQQMELGEPDQSGRRRPVPIEGGLETIQLDTIIAAIGQKVVPIQIDDQAIALELTDWQTIVADEESFQTSIPGVFAGGDGINNGPGIAIEAIGHAKRAVAAVDSYLKGHLVPYLPPFLHGNGEQPQEHYDSIPKEPRQKMPHLAPADRKNNFQEIVLGYPVGAGIEEANRCLECGCGDVFECKLLHYAQEYQVEPQRFSGEISNYPIAEDHPFIVRDNNKCILCGLCLRVCEEVVGVNALGLLDRGFNSSVEADFGVDLLDSRCVSCGQCVALCPTGALQEKQPKFKSVPLATEARPSLCNYCGIGCKLTVHTYGDYPVKVTPAENQQLCSSGRFGYPYLMSDFTMSAPLVRENGKLIPADWQQMELKTVKAVQALQSVYGREAIGVVIGDKLSTEEIFLARHLAHDILGTERIYSSNATVGGLSDVLGQDGSTNSLAELEHTDLVLVIGTNVIANYPMLGVDLNKQAKKGQQFILLNDQPSMLNQYALKQVSLGTDLTVLKQLAKALIALGEIPQGRYYEEFVADLATIEVSTEIAEIAKLYKAAKTAMIVFDRGRTTRAGAQLVAEIALLSGHLGKPRQGIIQMRPRTNSQGLVDMGVKWDLTCLNQDLADGKIKGLLTFGHDLKPELVSNLDFLFAGDTVISSSMIYADVVLPMAGFPSVTGSFTNFAGQVNQTRQLATPTNRLENWQLLEGLLQAFPGSNGFAAVEDVRARIADWYPAYRGAYLQGKAYASPEGDPVRLAYGYPFVDGLPRFQVIDTGASYYREVELSEVALATWLKAKKELGLVKK